MNQKQRNLLLERANMLVEQQVQELFSARNAQIKEGSARLAEQLTALMQQLVKAGACKVEASVQQYGGMETLVHWSPAAQKKLAKLRDDNGKEQRRLQAESETAKQAAYAAYRDFELEIEFFGGDAEAARALLDTFASKLEKLGGNK